MPFSVSDDNIVKIVIGGCAAAGSWLITLIFRNHLNLQKHQLWVSNNHPSKKEVRQYLSDTITPIKEDVKNLSEKQDEMMKVLYRIDGSKHNKGE